MQNNKEKITKILTDELCYCYCDNCRYNDYETYGDRFCDGCHRKYSNWALSPLTAEEIADEIIKKIYNNLYDQEIADEIIKKVYNNLYDQGIRINEEDKNAKSD